MKTSRMTYAAWSALLILLTPALALAHAHLTRSEPAANSRGPAPRTIHLWFSEAPEMARVSLVNAKGKSVEMTKPERGASKLDELATIKQALAPGRYIVKWYVMAADGHPSSGDFAFTVAPK